jgi:hypothetical protein
MTTYTLTRSNGTAPGTHKTMFYKVYANEHMIDIKAEMSEPYTEEYLQEWFQQVIDEHRRPIENVTLLIKSYED